MRKRVLIVLSALAIGFGCAAQETETEKPEFGFTAGCDLVSSYVWRGTHCGGASFQPSLGIEYAGLSLSGWGSTDFEAVANEFDLALAYSNWGFTLTATDYFFPVSGVGMIGDNVKGGYFEWDKKETGHQVEVSLGYDFSEAFEKFPLYLSWNTLVYGADLDADGDNRYSTYIEVGYPFTVKAITLDIAAGFTPWESQYQEGTSFNMVNLSLKASYDIKVTDSFKIPVFAQAVLNPNTENVYFIAGISF